MGRGPEGPLFHASEALQFSGRAGWSYNLGMLPGMTINVRGTTGLIVAAAIIVAVLIGFPAYRVFFGISVGIGVIVAGLLYLRNKYRPIKDTDVDNKRPLGLS